MTASSETNPKRIGILYVYRRNEGAWWLGYEYQPLIGGEWAISLHFGRTQISYLSDRARMAQKINP